MNPAWSLLTNGMAYHNGTLPVLLALFAAAVQLFCGTSCALAGEAVVFGGVVPSHHSGLRPVEVAVYGEVAALPFMRSSAANGLSVERLGGGRVAYGVIRLPDGGAAVTVRVTGRDARKFRVCAGSAGCRIFAVTRLD